MINHICIIFAMGAEAEPAISKLSLPEPQAVFGDHLPMRASTGQRGSAQLSIVLFGTDDRHSVDHIGTEAASLTTHLAVERFKPNLVISAGTAGGFASRGAAIGDVYLACDRFVYHDRRVNIPGFDRSTQGQYPAMNVTGLAEALQLKQGLISTGSALDMHDEDAQAMHDQGATIKEMEAAAVRWVAGLHNTPMTALKAVTDLVDSPHPAHEQFLKNLAQASHNLTHELVRVIDTCAGKFIEDLANRSALVD